MVAHFLSVNAIKTVSNYIIRTVGFKYVNCVKRLTKIGKFFKGTELGGGGVYKLKQLLFVTGFYRFSIENTN